MDLSLIRFNIQCIRIIFHLILFIFVKAEVTNRYGQSFITRINCPSKFYQVIILILYIRITYILIEILGYASGAYIMYLNSNLRRL